VIILTFFIVEQLTIHSTDFDEWNTKILSKKSFIYMCENETYYVEFKHNLKLVQKLSNF
jgi:uncharacterized secreted protein with C-terminal beta-propeller domain